MSLTWGFFRKPVGLLMLVCAATLALSAVTGVSLADGTDDITDATTSVSGYWTAIKVIAIAVVLFVIGRKLLRKI